MAYSRRGGGRRGRGSRPRIMARGRGRSLKRYHVSSRGGIRL